jgi:4-aminobutyrate aminotransferase/(S)-3-amino-2-methylpropionate transaminase
MGAIDIQTTLPGPKGQALLARRDAALPKGAGRATSVVAAKAHGALVTDVDGNTFIDFTSGIGVLNVGHTPDEVVAVIKEQAGDFIHLCNIVGSYEPYIALAEKLNEIVPIAGSKKTYLANTGAEAVETAIKFARAYTGRQAIVAYEGAYHGRTLLTMSLTSKYSLFKKSFGPFAPEIYRVPFPYAYRCPHCRHQNSCNLTCYEDLERAMVTHVDPSAVAAIIIEPVQGEGGFIPASYEYLRKVRELCTKHGILMIVDEVQAGFCRTGKWFSIEHSGVEPDLVVMAKSLAAGMPLAAVTGRAEILDAVHFGGVGSTYGGNPLACVAALKTIELMERDNLCQRADQIGEITMSYFNRWKERFDTVGDVRGLGAMTAVEFIKGKGDMTPVPEIPPKVVYESYKRGVMLIRAGIYTNCVRTLAPLTISDEMLEEGLTVMEEAIEAVESSL